MTSVCWFRKGLRVHDNAALHAAMQGSQLIPLAIIDPHFTARVPSMSPLRYNMFLESLEDLHRRWNSAETLFVVPDGHHTKRADYTLFRSGTCAFSLFTTTANSLTERGSSLVVMLGTPEAVLRKLLVEQQVDALHFEHDTEPYARQRDASISQLCSELDVQCSVSAGHTLLDVRQWGPKEQLARTYRSFLKMTESRVIPGPLEAPQTLPAVPKQVLELSEDATSLVERFGQPLWEGQVRRFPGGETEALARMRRYLQDKKRVVQFEKPKTDPTQCFYEVGEAVPSGATTVLSPYLKFGCLSARLFYQELRAVEKGRSHTKPPVSLVGQLMWREFFTYCSWFEPNFHRMQGNALCRQIQWDQNPAYLEAWRVGRTGYPWIDALMRQLRAEGWIHHLGRHAVACFLTRGDLYLSWEEGRQVFEEYLLDADYALNAANWMWLSASAFYHQYWKAYSPVAFGKKYDAKGYIRRWVPELRDVPDNWIYEPFKGPIAHHPADYPRPLVDHSAVCPANKQRMKEAYAKTTKKRKK